MKMLAFSFGIFFMKLVLFHPSKALQCGGTILINDSGFIQSPNYPQSYSDSGSCTWVLKAPAGYDVRLEFLDFDVESDDLDKCDYDSVKIRNGLDSHSPLLGKILCGQSTPEIVTSAGNVMSVTFEVDELSMMESRGFRAEYRKVQMNGTDSCLSSVCGGTYVNTTSCDVQSPGFPTSYDSNLNCSWRIVAPDPSHIISVEFLQLKLNQPNSLCRKNKVTLYDVSSSKLSVISESVCDLKTNDVKNKKILSKGPIMLIELLTTESSKSYTGVHGFDLKFEVIDPTTTTMPVTTTLKAPVKLPPSNPPATPSTSKPTTSTTETTTSSISVSSTTSTISTRSRKASTTTKTTSTTSTSKPKDESKDTPVKTEDKPKTVTSSNKTLATDTPESLNASPVVLSGLVIGIIVVIAVIVLFVLLLVAFSHWKKRNNRITRRLREEDARSDANTLLSSIDSREFTDMSKAKQKQQHPVITDRTEFTHETEGLL